LIAIPSAKGEQMRRIVEVCDKSGEKIPDLACHRELIDGSVSLKADTGSAPWGFAWAGKKFFWIEK